MNVKTLYLFYYQKDVMKSCIINLGVTILFDMITLYAFFPRHTIYLYASLVTSAYDENSCGFIKVLSCPFNWMHLPYVVEYFGVELVRRERQS